MKDLETLRIGAGHAGSWNTRGMGRDSRWSRDPLMLICGNLTATRYADEIVKINMRLHNLTLQQDNAWLQVTRYMQAFLIQ